jgi:hypothetical protein
MKRFVFVPVLAAALPLPPFNETSLCDMGLCEKPAMKYETMSKSQPGYQWGDSGGYCGSWAIGRAALAKGAYIDQQMVRDHTYPAPGGDPTHDEEILTTNIEEAFKNLKLKVEGFDYKSSPSPQQPAFFKWLKKQLVAGHPVTWFIMWDGQHYPLYNLKIPDDNYGHIEPVIGIQSNHPLTDETVYDDDVAVHFTDGSTKTIYKTFGSLSGDWAGDGHNAECQTGSRYCIGPYAHGWAVKGFLDEQEALPLSLTIDPWEKEPDLVKGEKPIQITGTLLAEGLTAGSNYDIYRWDSADDAFTYDDTYKIKSFTASSDTFTFEDPKTFSSYSTTYYRCVKATSATVV